MKNLIALTFGFLLSLSIFAQDSTHHVTYYRDGKLNEKYIINSNNEKDGEYVRFTRYGNKYISGQYKSGKPVGIWEYFSSDTEGVLVQKLDFDNHKELFVDPLKVTTLICGPRYFGGSMIQNEYIANRIKTDFTANEKAFYHGQNFTVTFTIDSVSMKPIGVSVDDPNLPIGFSSKMFTIISEMPAWLPPVCVDKSEVWRFSVVFIF